MTNRSHVLTLVLLLIARAAGGAVPWHHPLYLANHGYWPERVVVRIENPSNEPVAGKPVEVSVAELAGARVESVRVCRADGVELLFDLRDATGASKRSGMLAKSDRLVVPAECAARSASTLCVYAGNNEAWAVPDFLPAAASATNLKSSQAPPGGGNSGTAEIKSNETASGSGLRISVGKLEHLELAAAPALKPKTGSDWENWAEVRIRNFDQQSAAAALVRVNLRPALARLPGVPLGAKVRVASGDGVEPPAYHIGGSAGLLFKVELRPRSEQLFQLGFGRPASADAGAVTNDYERLLETAANLVANGDFESGRAVPDAWSMPVTGGPHEVAAGFSREARFGHRGLELKVAENAKAEWIGWKSPEIPVKPGATYLLSGWLKAVGLKGSAGIHAHFHNAGGALTQSGAMASTQPGVGGDSEWTASTAFLQAPLDAATIQLHLTMNTAGTLRHDGVVLCQVRDGEVVGVHTAGGEKSGPALRVWEVNPLVKVFPDTPPQGQARTVQVELARNEYEPFQLAVRYTLEKARRLEFKVSPLRNEAGAELPPVKIERVGFVPVDYPSAYYSTDVPDWCRKVPRGAGATDGWAGWWPDPLIPMAAFELASSQTQPVWFTVRAPKEAPPGLYRGEVNLQVDGVKAESIPLVVQVLPFALPDRTRLQVIFDFRFGPGGVFGSGAESPAERRRWLRFMAEHRLGIDTIHPSPRFNYKNGQVTMDAGEFDEAARYCFEELGMSVAYTPSFFYMFGWAYPPKQFFGLAPLTPEWTAAFKHAYKLFSDHVRDKGWHDRFVYYVADEPHFDQPFVVEQMKKLCALIHEVDPTIPIYSSTWRHCPAWDDSLDLWGIGQYGCFPVTEMERLPRASKGMWFTCDGQMATDTPFLATERMLPYYCFKYGVKGFEFWGLAWWTYDPWKIGWHRFIRQSEEGKRYYWVRYPDGDGYLAYPGKAVGVDGPVSTIRLEQLREGLEDYEAMAMLAELAEKAKRAGKSVAKAERALAMAKELVVIPNAGGLQSTEILPEPDCLPQIRKAVNAALLDLVP